jgi:KaiC/GvpD/RAD55 family RecA-like ATPase
MVREFSTGVHRLDQVLAGGVRAGTVVLVETPPETQGELLLRAVAADHHVVYLTGTRSAERIEAWFDPVDATPDVYDMADADPAGVLSTALSDLPPESVVVVDPVDVVERAEATRESLVRTLRLLARRGRETESLVVAHALDTATTPDRRRVTRQFADSVWSLLVDDGPSLETRLHVTKRRNGAVPSDALKLELGDEVTVDTSRDIA